MELFELIIKSSIQIILSDKDTLVPLSFGSGCLVKYHNQIFLLSVSHVTRDEKLGVFIESSQTPVNNQSLIDSVTSLNYFSVFELSPGDSDPELTKMIEDGGKLLDITFAEYRPSILLEQPTVDLGFYKIHRGEKVYLDLNQATVPDTQEEYGFYGNVKIHYTGKYLKRTPALIHSLKFHRSSGHFHMFLAPSIITDSENFKGCSGAPILDSQGQLVALACQVGVGTRIIYGFSILECKRLIDTWLTIQNINNM